MEHTHTWHEYDVDAQTEREQAEYRYRLRHGGEAYPGENDDRAMGLIPDDKETTDE